MQQNYFDVLRTKWHEVPAGAGRVSTKDLLGLSDECLLDQWKTVRTAAATGAGFPVRGWYQLLYKDVLCGKRVMDVGSGFGIDGLTFAQNGARMTFVDIVESNLSVLERLCRLMGIHDAEFCYLKDLATLEKLTTGYDVIWCQGSMINAPFEFMHREAQELLKHLPIGGRWIELAYPKTRWEREGRLPFDKWGERTDGWAPWVEWYDIEKLKERLHPASFDVVLQLEFFDSCLNWFDLVRRG